MLSTHIFGRTKPSDEDKAKDVLRKALSPTHIPSTGSEIYDTSQQGQYSAYLHAQIGKGQCGTIFVLGNTDLVIKLPNSASKYDELYNDFRIHRRVQEAFEQHPYIINVPKLGMWVDSKSDHFWADRCSLFDGDIKVPNYGLVSERICSLSASLRLALVDVFCPKRTEQEKKEFLGANKDCLIRLYLGSRNTAQSPSVSLRNFPLHVNEMEKFQLDAGIYAQIVAKALAMMHWRVGIDANDVEFVLGGSPQIRRQHTLGQQECQTKDTAASLYHSDFQHRTVSVWLLDFNLCKTFDISDVGLEQLVKGFWWNDPYYPRPNSADPYDQKLWKLFQQEYLKSSSELTDSGMPSAFIEGVIAEGQKRSGINLFI